ncbi:MAG: ATP-binding protein [Cyanobacteria bacterium J06643_5]
MTQPISRNNLGSYLSECFRILYWAYLKPYTFTKWLQDIHPQLKPTDNPFKMRNEFDSNPKLHRYAEQVWWITAVIPVLILILSASMYQLITKEYFNWLQSSLFWLGWWLGLFVARSDNQKLEKRFKRLLVILLAVTILAIAISSSTGHLSNPLPDWLYLLGYSLLGTALGIAWGISWGVEWGLAWGLAWGAVLLTSVIVSPDKIALPVAVISGVVWRVTWIVASSVTSGVALGVALGLVWSITLGLVWNQALGVILSIVWILGILRIYLWLPEFLWMVILFVISQRSNTVFWLSYLPSRIDQRIILPLPFMVKMLVNAYKENPIAVRQTIDYLITFTNQKKVAIKATTQIAVDTLKECKTLQDISTVAEQLDWIHFVSSQDYWILPQLLDISRNVRASYTASSTYLQHKLLDNPINGLRELTDSRTISKNAYLAATFGSIAYRWINILKTAKHNLRQEALNSKEIRQVYIAGNALEPNRAKERFKGRDKVFEEIEKMALSEQPPVLLLYGGRRTGKTSALNYLPDNVGADLIPLLVDIQGAAVATTLVGLAEFFIKKIQEATRRLRPRIELPSPNRSKLAQDPFIELQNWLEEIEINYPSKRFLLCLDEFERLNEVVKATGSNAPLNFLRHIIQYRSSWILLFSGNHYLSELPDYWSDYLINAHALKMTYLTKSEARELIKLPVSDFPDVYEDSAVDAIVELTHCQPYLVQLMCCEVVEKLNRDFREYKRDTDIDKANIHDVEMVIPKVLERGIHYFRELWINLTEGEKRLLIFIVQDKIYQKNHSKVALKLVQKEILQQKNAGYCFQVPLVQKYIEQLAEEEI